MILEIDPKTIEAAVLVERVNRSLLQKGLSCDVQKQGRAKMQERSDNSSLRRQLTAIQQKVLMLYSGSQIAETPIEPQGRFGRVKSFFKRGLLKMTRWLWHPMLAQQNAYGAAVSQLLEEIVQIQSEMLDTMESKNE